MNQQDETMSLTGGLPTSDSQVTAIAPPIVAERNVVADTGREYIASDYERAYWLTDYGLPQSVDAAERKFGLDLYEKKMLEDGTVAGVVKALKILVLADGFRVTNAFSLPPRVGATSEQINDYDQGDRMREYVHAVVDLMTDTSDESLFNVCHNLLDACHLGHKLAEVTYNVIGSGEFKDKYGIERIACKPRRNYNFVVDPMNRVRGIIARVPGVSILQWTGYIFDISQLPNAIPPEKLLMFTVDKKDGDPRGQSWFRGVYDAYYRKQLAKPSEVKALDQAGGQMVYAIAGPNRTPVTDFTNPSGPMVNPITATFNALKYLRSGNAAVFDDGTEVKIDRPEGNLQMFELAFSRYDQEIVRAYLLSARSVLEAKHGSKADSDSASDLVDELKMYVRNELCSCLNRLSRRLVLMSFGPEMLRYAPIFKMQRASRPDFAANAAALAPFLTSAKDDLTEEQWDYFMVEVLGAPPGRVQVQENLYEDNEDEDANDEGDPAAMAGRFPGRYVRTSTRRATFARWRKNRTQAEKSA